ncbi:hypothetical protein [Desulforegula conservatrix]|uniref:hypothetical protein n=1 Tax=Desulforegula conservatrix TaxID=153026 RepID=UPI00042161A3|nr:hypothetical protein [Desulforegula conservatrix]
MSNRTYIATRHPVSTQHSIPPTSFLDQLIDAIDPLPNDVFAENPIFDIYAVMKGSLGPYTSLKHRKAVMCEVLRVQAAFESDWNWNEGVDINNLRSLTHIEGEETGAFQVSFDSTALGHSAMMPFAISHQIETPQKFIHTMKSDHRLAVEYCARLLRISTAWCGTIKNPAQVISHVRRDAVEEFQTFLHVGIDVPLTAGIANSPGSLAPGGGCGAEGTGDKARTLKVVQIANDPSAYQKVQEEAAKELFKLADEDWPHDGCAINLSNLLQAGGIPVPDILQALALGKHLRDHRGWQVIPNGQQQPGDVGSTCGSTPNHGFDHIYLVLQRVDNDEMVIADNQKPKPHTRFVSGKGGKTPTKFFLRAT